MTRNEIKNIPGFVFRGTTLTEYTGEDSVITVPEGVTAIGEHAFCKTPEAAAKVREVALPSSIRELGESAFAGCMNLKKLTGTENLRTLGREALSMCQNLENIDLKNAERIDFNALYSCRSLTRLDLAGASYIEDGALKGCENLEELNLSEVYYNTENQTRGETGRSNGEGGLFQRSLSDWHKLCIQIIVDDQTADADIILSESPALKTITVAGKRVEAPASVEEKDYRLFAGAELCVAAGHTLIDAEKAEREEKKRKNQELLREERKKKELCQYCGGSFTGLFRKKCLKCGAKKDY